MGMMEEEDPAGGGGRLLPQMGQATVVDEPCINARTSFYTPKIPNEVKDQKFPFLPHSPIKTSKYKLTNVATYLP